MTRIQTGALARLVPVGLLPAVACRDGTTTSSSTPQQVGGGLTFQTP